MSDVISTSSLGLRLGRSHGKPCPVCGAPAATCGPDHMTHEPIDRPERARKDGAGEKTIKAPNKRMLPPDSPTPAGETAPTQGPTPTPAQEPRARSQRRRRVSGK